MDCVSAGKVLVQLFSQIQPKYELNNRKLQYLLCIAQMSRLSYGETLFDEDIKNLKNGFTLDAIADTFIYKTNIVDGKITNMPINSSVEELVVPFKCKAIYKITETLADEDVTLLKDVFLRFGAFGEAELCWLLNGFSDLKTGYVFDVVSKTLITKVLSKMLDGPLSVKNVILSFLQEKRNIALFVPMEPVAPVLEAPAVSVPVVSESIEVVPQPVPTEEFHEIIENKPVENPVVFKKDFLKKFSSLPKVSVGKNCCVLIEVDSDKVVEDVCVFATKLKDRIQGTLCKVNDNIYRYSFVSVASDVKISAVIVNK